MAIGDTPGSNNIPDRDEVMKREAARLLREEEEKTRIKAAEEKARIKEEQATVGFEGRIELDPDRKRVPEGLVGFSLSFCVASVLRGEVDEAEIKEIITGTNAPTPEAIDELINNYKTSYWRDNPEEGEAIARRLFAAGKIKQPRALHGQAPNISRGHWVPKEISDLEYKKRTSY